MKLWNVLALVALFGCSNDDKIDKAELAKRQDAENAKKKAVFAKYEGEVGKLIDKAKSVAPLLKDVPSGKGAAPPKTDPPIVLSELHLDDMAGNADVLLSTEIKEFNRGMLGTAAYDLDLRSSVDAALAEDILARAGRTKYFIVVRPDGTRMPQYDGGDTYKSGVLFGDAVVFDLRTEPPKPLGAFSLEAELTKTIKVSSRDTVEMIRHELDEALRRTALDEIEKRLTAKP